VKRLSADDSADSRVKVGHRQATYDETGFLLMQETGFFRFDFCFFISGTMQFLSPKHSRLGCRVRMVHKVPASLTSPEGLPK
jgi:hypothetical protein